jgi:hypothetical protein
VSGRQTPGGALTDAYRGANTNNSLGRPMKNLHVALSFLALSVIAGSIRAESATPFNAKQVWKGSYTCAQGDTNLVLRIRTVSESPVETELGKALGITAVFDFDHNNRSAAGAFYVSGRYYLESGATTFDPGEWIRQPSGYTAVGMDGLVSRDGKYFSGKILFSGCRNFQLQLTN